MPPHVLWLLQRECHQRITQWLFFDLGMAAGGDHNILLSLGIQLICDGHGMAIGWELSFPQLLASFYVEGTDDRIECSGNEDQTACGDDWASQARRAGRNRCSVSNAEVLHRAERHLPTNFAFHHIDSGQCSPRRRAAWHEARRKERSTEHAVRRSPLTANSPPPFMASSMNFSEGIILTRKGKLFVFTNSRLFCGSKA